MPTIKEISTSARDWVESNKPHRLADSIAIGIALSQGFNDDDATYHLRRNDSAGFFDACQKAIDDKWYYSLSRTMKTVRDESGFESIDAILIKSLDVVIQKINAERNGENVEWFKLHGKEMKEKMTMTENLTATVNVECIGCNNSRPNGHEHSHIECPSCGSIDQCWNCSVQRNDSAGEEIFTCRKCGYELYYPISIDGEQWL